MVTYYINQHLLSAKVRTVIKDSQGKPVFLLVGSWGTRGDSISIYTLEDTLLASVKQVTFSSKIKFDLYEHREKVGTLSHLFKISRDIYFVKKRHWLILSNLNKQHYQIYHCNQIVMQLTKETTYKGDYFKIDIRNKADAPLCLCIAAVLDYLAKRDNKLKNFNKQLAVEWLLD